MKSHIVPAEKPVDQAGYDVLPGMILHMRKPPLPVDLSPHGSALRERSVRIMDDLPAAALHIRHTDAAERPLIGRLSAAFRIKSRVVQHHGKSLFSFSHRSTFASNSRAYPSR